jgi:hypothetical protein
LLAINEESGTGKLWKDLRNIRFLSPSVASNAIVDVRGDNPVEEGY